MMAYGWACACVELFDYINANPILWGVMFILASNNLIKIIYWFCGHFRIVIKEDE